ncbi:MAG: hypothetical protein AAGD32_00395 [Planctomycetota bacterium]
MNPRTLLVTALLLLPTVVGCQTSSMTPGELSAVQPVSSQPRVGNAYLMRGWIGVFSTGIDSLTEQLNEAGVRAHIYQNSQYRDLGATIRDTYAGLDNHEPIILIGHSYGADDMIRIAKIAAEKNVEIDLLITLDPVTPPNIPPNVKRAVNLYQPNGAWDILPVLRGVAVKPREGMPENVVENWNLRGNRKDILAEAEGKVDHFNIEKKAVVHDAIKELVLEYCPPRMYSPQLVSFESPDNPKAGGGE